MKKLGVYQILGPGGCNDARIPDYCRQYLEELSRKTGMEIYPADEKEFCEQELKIFFIGSGGTAEAFSKVYRCVKGPYYLLTVPAWNSLAASMEILSFLHENQEKGEVLHGTAEENADKIKICIRLRKRKKSFPRCGSEQSARR